MNRSILKGTMGLIPSLLVLPFFLVAQRVSIESQLKGEYQITMQVDYKYLVEMPEQSVQGDRLPLMIFLHGSGERGDDLELVRVHGPWKYLRNHPEQPFIVLAPQCKAGEFWDPRKLDLLLNEIIQSYPVDTSRIYLTGLSMGGYGTWDWALHNPERFAAIAPVCGTTYRQKLMAEKVKNLPVWIFHGVLDDIVPLQNSAKMAEKLKGLGADVQFTVYPFTGHNAWDKAYAEDELYHWFLTHRRP